MAKEVKTDDIVVSATDLSFDEEVLLARKPVLVDFWAPWCGPCRMISPTLEELGREYADRARIVKLNVDENPTTAARYGIASLPTLLLFKGGRVVDQVIGAAGKRTIAARIESHLN